mgnify:CR=1 FL=1
MNKLNKTAKIILDDINFTYGNVIPKGSDDNALRMIRQGIVLYVKSIIPNKKTMPPEDSYDLGYNDATFDMIKALEKDMYTIDEYLL